jgi:putative endopeptidase
VEPIEAWKTYLRWHVISSAAPALHQAADAEHFAFFGKVLEGKKEQSLRWKRAVKAVDEAIPDALGQLYVAQHFPPAAKQRMEAMVTNIKAVYADHIRQTAWMTQPTREKALVKLAKFRAKLGYPSKWKSYAGLDIKRDDYYGNLQRASLLETKRQLARVGQTVDREEWFMSAPTVNAYFNQNNNEIVFPAGILQPPFFDLSLDDAVNYGSTGAVIGHEMTHGFDSEGRKFNAEGNLEDWWTEADGKEFNRRSNVLVEDFNSRDGLPGIKVNGKLTLPENIADLGGIVLAYEGLERAIKADPKLGEPIGGFTPQQRYFLSYSQSWMQLAQAALIRKRMASDPHSPDQIRAVAPLQNFQAWYDTFKIPAQAKLYIAPEKRAVIW